MTIDYQLSPQSSKLIREKKIKKNYSKVKNHQGWECSTLDDQKKNKEMRNFIFLAFTLVFFQTMGQNANFFSKLPAQKLEAGSIEVFYNLKFQHDSMESNRIGEELMLLISGQNFSVFSSYNMYKLDSTNIHLDIATIQQLRQNHFSVLPPPSRFNYFIYKNFPKGKITTTGYIMPDHFKYSEPLLDKGWILTREKKVISGYSAQKATINFGGRSWVAWFTPEIPISEGPYKFSGLPGLIIFLHDTKNHYVFEMVSFNHNTNRSIEFPEKRYIEISKKNFLKVEMAFRENIIEVAKQYGLDNHAQQVAAENLRRRNNPIELTAD